MTMKLSLILLPGLLCDAALWKHQVERFGSLAECMVPDTTKQDRIDLIARDILATAPPQFALAALSMGGYIALEIMRQAPERVLKLCLLDTSARADTAQQQQRRKMLIAMSSAGQFKGVTPRLLPMLIHPDRLEDKELTGIVMAMAERVGHAAFRNQQNAILNRVDSRGSLKNIMCPVQLIVGQQDALTPPDVMQEIADAIPQARLNTIDHCGHLSSLEKPDEVTGLMKRWLVG